MVVVLEVDGGRKCTLVGAVLVLVAITLPSFWCCDVCMGERGCRQAGRQAGGSMVGHSQGVPHNVARCHPLSRVRYYILYRRGSVRSLISSGS